jgi:hypothetical protein
LKILITGKFSPYGDRPIGGLQSWIRTVNDELTNRGFRVDIKEPYELDETKYDIGIFSNIDLTRKAVEHCKDSVLVSHGIIQAEKPDDSCKRLLFVSEGVQDHWKMNGEVIRQPIDLNYWKPQDNEPKYITRFSYRTGNTHCQWVAEQMGKPFIHVKNKTQQEARRLIRKSALVFATGRAALEAMACGVPVVIYDHRDAYQPPLIGKSLSSQIKHSYSGRGGITPSREQVLDMAEKAVSNRKWVEAHHNVKEVVNCLL